MGHPVTTNPIIIMLINMSIVFVVLMGLSAMIRLIHLCDPTNKAKEVKKPAAAPKAAAPAPVATGAAGSVKIEAGAAGKVVKIAAAAGTAVKKGDPVVVLEVMKMETPVVAPQDGTVASINCNEGQQVEAGALLATMN